MSTTDMINGRFLIRYLAGVSFSVVRDILRRLPLVDDTVASRPGMPPLQILACEVRVTAVLLNGVDAIAKYLRISRRRVSPSQNIETLRGAHCSALHVWLDAQEQGAKA
ncbi:hypothetical protein [Rubellimicrobium roseum]|uniref:Uncharacterized protein n=1 Tax=Rubellimicrobium roseum TaxID=687525 RepID=A0A5C4N5W1_9RHOB|nr:hypothetical protein [Rubellimicrobium roseum]TNC60467.1 hypothetical protein FHG71_21990 [Rubellimicrobium roseum]